MQSVEIPIGDGTIRIETGKVARQAHGAVWMQQDDTVVLVTAVSDPTPNDRGDFLPLTVDYRERGYAIGKIPHVYGRREPRPGVPSRPEPSPQCALHNIFIPPCPPPKRLRTYIVIKRPEAICVCVCVYAHGRVCVCVSV